MRLTAKRLPRHYQMLLGGSLLLLLLIVVTRPDRSGELRAPDTPTVAVGVLQRGELNPTLRVRGSLQPRLSATLSAEVAGQVVARSAEPGQWVEQGALLLQLADGDYRNAFTHAEAQLEQERAAVARDRRLRTLARKNRELAEREVKRLEKLGSESLTSVSRLDEARQRLLQLQGEEARLDYSVDTADSRIALRTTELERAERNLARTRISAPFAGTVNELLTDVGDRIILNQQVASLVALDELDLYAEFPGDSQTNLTLGQPITITVEGHPYQGRLLSLQREPDRTTYTLALRIRIPAEGLSPGTLAEVELPLRPLSDVLLAPVSALLREDGHAYLFVEEQGRLSRREVEAGVRHGTQVVIRHGVEAGQRIVLRDVAALSDGQQVVSESETGQN
ncbi:MAG: efflux RND transporter periplasmic adaptor subunit [Chromatiales bacterium]|nr:efflux RND transporter periplasmic adaptor subunit [Chromatiales bacterium]